LLVATHSGNYNVQVSNADSCKIAVGINVILTDIESLSHNDEIVIFPNPATDELSIQTELIHPDETMQVSVLNMLGELLQEEKLKRNREAKINIKTLPAGIYFLQIKSEKESTVKKFIKE
jgi:hypothetical protein